MSKVEQLQKKLRRFSPAELKRVHAFLDDLVEDYMASTPEFEADIRESENEMAVGKHSWTRKP